MRAVQSRRCARLQSEAAEQLRAFLGVAVFRRREDLEGDLPAQVLVPGPPDLPHATRAQPFQKPVPPTHQPSPHPVPRPPRAASPQPQQCRRHQHHPPWPGVRLQARAPSEPCICVFVPTEHTCTRVPVRPPRPCGTWCAAESCGRSAARSVPTWAFGGPVGADLDSADGPVAVLGRSPYRTGMRISLPLAPLPAARVMRSGAVRRTGSRAPRSTRGRTWCRRGRRPGRG